MLLMGRIVFLLAEATFFFNFLIFRLAIKIFILKFAVKLINYLYTLRNAK